LGDKHGTPHDGPRRPRNGKSWNGTPLNSWRVNNDSTYDELGPCLSAFLNMDQDKQISSLIV